MADDILTTKDVLGLIGCEYSTTAKIPAQIFSLNKLPYGSFCSTSPRLADKANFSFFWRPLPSAGGHISALFKFWNVRRYAIIYESDDDMASQYAKSIIYFMASSNIRLLASIGISSDISSEVVDYVYASIQQTNSRYIIISGQSNFQNQIYFDLAKKGLIGSQYVYVTYSASTAAIDETAHGDALFQKYPGLIKFFSPATNSSNPLYREFYNEALSIMGASKEEISFEWFVSKNLEPNFDAAMIMLLGFDKVMKSNPNYTPEMLASRTLNSYMNYTLFQNVSYNGLLVAPLILNSVGDLNLPYVVAYYSANQSLLKAFGQTDMFGTSFEYLPNLKPVFYGGSSSPPPDGPPIFSPTELILDIQTSSGVFLLSVLVIGILECTASIVFLYCFRHKATMKRTSIAFLTPTTIGSTIFCISIVFLYGEASVQKCILKVWFQILGYCLIIGSLIMKMNMSVQLL
ncbi:periplasmic binding protein-like I [Rhizoclosmatium globosum]|uniref:Periplasmic binding protein-like I n=1 Tax=Rhizoclosmatium globosum TaxID=329046 RepID=A0A1Y2CW59_9FUNG|nr:periplasmic binding protein-like I [Rhizoclosmatium globosum]|eukprot:ORY51269.1 periplasmic binding protein-like I [Rhizoclosmatium globosum]